MRPNRLPNPVFDIFAAMIVACKGIAETFRATHDRWFCLNGPPHLGGCLDVDHRMTGEAVENMHYVKPDWEAPSY
jgi:hypothetical protein